MGNALALIGIFGLMTYSIRQRRREIGVRMALAATPGTVMRMLIAPGMRYALPGTLIGAAVALWLAHWLKSFLFGVGAMGLRTLVSVASLMIGAAVVICGVAGARAARIHPVEAISTE